MSKLDEKQPILYFGTEPSGGHFFICDGYQDDITPQTMTMLTSASATSDAAWRTIFAGDIAVYQAHKEVVLQV